MVGDPKHLSDLAQIEAAVSARCRTCGHSRVFDRDGLISFLRCHGGIPAWSALRHAIPCRCGSTDLTLKPMPYAGEVRDPELRRHQRVLIELAVALLDDAAGRISGSKAQTVAVRLALRVLLPHVAHRGDLTAIWHSAGTENPIVRATGFEAAVDGVRLGLRMLGRL